jgi:N,N'-diacetyllegionaminate synthase
VKVVRIGEREVGKGKPVLIVAEAGDNHNGKLVLALRLVAAAKEAGADAVKFQTFVTEELVTKSAGKAPYQDENEPESKTQFEMLKGLELNEKDFEDIKTACKQQGIMFLSSPFDEPSVEMLERLGVPAFKIPSGEIDNFPLLELIASKGKPVILSTGMSTLEEVREAVEVLRKGGVKELVLLQCTSNYPASFDSLNLRAMGTLEREFDVPVGYSDHSLGIEASVAAAAMGACMIEKHLTLDKTLPGPDHVASLEPEEFAAMVSAIRNVEKALGDGRKVPHPSEESVRKVARKSIKTLREIPKGTKLDKSMLKIKRPASGWPPKMLREVIGHVTEADSGADMDLTSKIKGIEPIPLPRIEED